MGFLDRLQSDQGKRYPKPVNPKDGPQPPGRFSFGTQTEGGPRYTDAFNARRAPSQLRLVENYSALIYAMVNRTRDGVTRVPIRLLADGSRAQGKPSRACDPIKVSRSIGRKLAAKGKVSTAAVDQVYEIRDHPLLDVLDDPDPYGTFTREKLIGILCMFMDVLGSGYLVPEGRGWDWTNPSARPYGPPEQLWVIYPQYAIPVRLGTSPIVDRFQYFSSSIPSQSVLWFRHNYSIRDVYGAAFSPTYAGESYRQQEQELVAILSQVLGIGPRPNLLVTAKDGISGITPLQKQAFEQDLVRKHSAYGAGGVLVNDGSWDVTPIDYPKADIAARDIAQHDRDNLANVFGMPPTYFTVDSNLANLQAADAQFAKANTEPRLKTICSMLTRWARLCSAEPGDKRMVFMHDPVTEEDDESREKVFTMMLGSGRATINQVNEEEKWPAVPWGDEPLMPNNLVPISMLIAQAQQTLEQGKLAIESGAQSDEIAADGHEHQKEMDKEKLKIDAKKAEQKPAETKRSVDELAENVLRGIEEELILFRKAGNPNHVPSGSHGGEFAPGGGGAGATKAHGKHWAKRQRRKAKKRKPGEKREHKPTAKAKLDRIKKGKPAEYGSVKAKRAAENQNVTDSAVQRYTKANEDAMAKRLGGQSFADNGAVDVTVKIGKETHGIELKTLTSGKNDKVTMAAKPKPYEKESAIDRKVKWQNENGTTVHTVVADHRDRFEGGKNKELHSGNELYYKRGTGSFRIGAMHPVKDVAELHKLMKTPYDQLPKKAQGDRRGGKT